MKKEEAANQQPRFALFLCRPNAVLGELEEAELRSCDDIAPTTDDTDLCLSDINDDDIKALQQSHLDNDLKQQVLATYKNGSTKKIHKLQEPPAEKLRPPPDDQEAPEQEGIDQEGKDEGVEDERVDGEGVEDEEEEEVEEEEEDEDDEEEVEDDEEDGESQQRLSESRNPASQQQQVPIRPPAIRQETPVRGRGRPPKVQQQQPLAEEEQTTLPPHLSGATASAPSFQAVPGLPQPSARVPVVAAAAAAQHVARLRDMLAAQNPPLLPPCKWFDPSCVTQEEVNDLKSSFPSLRVVSSVSESDADILAYITLRNTLIDVYRAYPQQRLTLAECRKHCDGDLAALIRVLSFLERNRLVNFAIKNPNAQGPPIGGTIISQKLKDDLRSQWSRTPTCTACDRICLYSFYVLSPAVYGGTLPLPQLKPALWCADCAREAPYNQCLSKVCLPAMHLSGWAASWSESQTTVLFDAIENYGPEWMAVSKVVSAVPGNPVRSPRECLAAFLSMPISEPPSALQVVKKSQSPPAKPVMDPNKAAQIKLGMQILSTATEILLNQSKEGVSPVLSDLMKNLTQDADEHTRVLTETSHTNQMTDYSDLMAEPV